MFTIIYTMDGERGNFERSFDNGAEAYSFAEYAREMGKVVEIRIERGGLRNGMAPREFITSYQ